MILDVHGSRALEAHQRRKRESCAGIIRVLKATISHRVLLQRIRMKLFDPADTYGQHYYFPKSDGENFFDVNRPPPSINIWRVIQNCLKFERIAPYCLSPVRKNRLQKGMTWRFI